MILNIILKNKIKEIKNSYKKLKINIIKYVCYKKKFKRNNYFTKTPITFIENKSFSPIYGKFNLNKSFLNKFKKKKYFSLLTDIKYFGGHSYIINILSKMHKIILRKDFILDYYQILENYFNNNITLIIYSILKKKILNILKIIKFLNINFIIETKTTNEIKQITQNKIIKKNIIGLNNRNLNNFKFNFKKINEIVNKKFRIISESGIKNINYIFKFFNRNINFFLVGESINKFFFFFYEN
ncbi:hypothetical protein [Candidatus Vidania fulgoroideorum]